MTLPFCAEDIRWGRNRYRVEWVTVAGNHENEDALLVAPPLIGVADGATPLEHDRDMDAGVLARLALQELRANVGSAPKEMLRRAIYATSRLRLPGKAVASCTVAFAVADGADVTVTVLGDCLATIRTKDGRVQVVQDERLEARDAKAAAELLVRLRSGKAYEDARREIEPMLRKHRAEMNREGTYWTFADNPASAEHAFTTSLDQRELDALLLCTDGFAALVNQVRLASSPQELLDWAMSEGLGAPVHALRKAELAPRSMERFPRLSITDDVTAILVSAVRSVQSSWANGCH